MKALNPQNTENNETPYFKCIIALILVSKSAKIWIIFITKKVNYEFQMLMGERYMYMVNISEVKAGMVIEKPVYSPIDNKMLLTYGTILKDTIIRKLADIGIKQLEIADQYTIFLNPADQMAIILKENYNHIIKKYSSKQPEGNLCDAMIPIAQMVKKTVDLICENAAILDICLQMKIIKDSRLFNYSILTSVFSGLVAGALNLQEDMFDIMVGGLLHNLGCLEMPFLIGVKRLKGQEELLWKEHPLYGYYFSIQQNIPRSIAEIILHHHENWDGSGYPKHLKGEDIPFGARIVSVCSTISDQIYFEHIQPYESMEYLYCGSNIFFDKRIVDAFVNNITLYPLGALVRLSTGEVGIISNVRYNHGQRPIVNVYYNDVNKPLLEPKIVDLGKERTVFISEVL